MRQKRCYTNLESRSEAAIFSSAQKHRVVHQALLQLTQFAADLLLICCLTLLAGALTNHVALLAIAGSRSSISPTPGPCVFGCERRRLTSLQWEAWS